MRGRESSGTRTGPAELALWANLTTRNTPHLTQESAEVVVKAARGRDPFAGLAWLPTTPLERARVLAPG